LAALAWSTPAETGLPTSLSNVTAVMAIDHSILLVGGNSSAVYDEAYGSTTWTSVNPLASSGYPVTASAPGVSSLGAGKFLLYGNLTVQIPDDPISISALRYDPNNAGNIAAAAAMLSPRSQFAFATDGSNDAYAIGGVAAGSTTILSSVESYNPSSGWSTLAPLPQPISGAVAAFDGNGHIFVFGGMTGATTSTATLTGSIEEYTIGMNTWSTLGETMPTAVTQAAAVLGTDGMIYVLGGKGASGGSLAAVQVYNPVLNSWSSGTALPHSLSNEAAVVDGDGRVQVIGQYGADTPVQVVYVSSVLANVPPAITTTTLPAAMAGNPYTAFVNVTATPPATITVQSGPANLNIDPNTGEITWTPPEGLANTNQSVTIQATNAYGTATQTLSLAVAKDTTIPTPPTYLSVDATNITASSLGLTWTGSTDGDGVAGYNLYKYIPPVGRSGRGGGIIKPAQYILLVTGIPGTSYTVTGLSPGTSYQYAVAAYDPAGNVSGYSNYTTGTTYIKPTILTYLNGAPAGSTFSVVANHQLTIGLADPGNPTPTLSMSSAPSGVVFSGGGLTWTPTAAQVGTSDIIMQSTNVVGTTTLDIQVTVTPDVAVPSLVVNGSLTYTVGNMTTASGNPASYQLTLNPGFNNNNPSNPVTPQYGMVGTLFTFQVTGTSNTNPTTYALVSYPSGMTLDQNTGIGTWTPSAAEAGTTNVEVSMTNGAGTSMLTFTFPTYFTTAPTNVALSFKTSVSNTPSTSLNSNVTWSPPSNAAGVADYKVAVYYYGTNSTTVYDTGSTATSYALTGLSSGQGTVTVTAYDASGAPSQTSAPANLYLAALPTLGWNYSAPNAVVGQPFTAQFNSNQFTYSIVSGPAAASINPTTGLLTWTPTLSDVGVATFVVAAANIGQWGTIDATLTVPVDFTNSPATLTWTGASGGNWTTGPWSAGGPAFPDATVNAAITSPVTVQVTAPQAANALAITSGGQVAVAAGASLAVTTNTSVTSGGALNVDPNGAFSTGGTLTVDSGGSVSGPITASAYQLNNGSASANLAGPGSLTKSGSGTVVLSGTNTFAGPTQVTAGTLIVTNSAALPDGSELDIGLNASTAFAAPVVPIHASAAAASVPTAAPAPSANTASGPLSAGTSSTSTVRDLVLQSGIARPNLLPVDVTWLWDAIASSNESRTDNSGLTARIMDLLPVGDVV
jgi:autotransporter-associated beta strand protein